MKKTVSILCLAFFAAFLAPAYEYGLRLKPLPGGADDGTSLVLNNGEPIRSRGLLELSFDVRSISDEPYGCVCRLVGDRGYVIDLINSVSRDHRWVPLLIAGGKSIELQSDIRWGEWNRVSLVVDTKNGSVSLDYGGEQVAMNVPVIKGSNSFRISFGQCPFDKFDVDVVASSDIRDIRLSSGRKVFAEWSLRMHSGNSSPDLSGRRMALSTESVWLADELIKPKPLLHVGCGKGTCIAFDGNKGFLIIDDPARIITFDAVALTLDSLRVTDGVPPANATNQAIFTGESLISYNLLGNTYATFDPVQRKWSGGKSTNKNDYYTNYTAIWDPDRKKLYCFGGYGFFHLYNDLRICDPAHPDSLKIVSLTGISPRFFPSSALLDGQIYIFGVKGTKSGNQELTQNYNYDLYSFDPDSGVLTSIWALPVQPEDRYVPGENMVWEPSEGCFYTALIPDETDFVVARVYRDKPSVEMASLPTEGIRRRCNWIYVNLFLNAERNRLFIVSIQSEKNDETFLDILALDYPVPPLSGIILPPAEQRIPILPVAVFAFVILSVLSAALLVRRNHKLRGDETGFHPDNYYDFARNSVCLFGGFSVHDCNGNDITSQFTPTLRQLLTLLILYSSKDSQGVINARINKTIWYYKPEESANNNRNVTMRRLRTLLEGIKGASIISKNKYWRIEFAPPAQSDYFEALRLYRDGKSNKNVNHLLELLLRGELLPDTAEEWTVAFKNDFSIMTVDFFSGLLSREDLPESIIMQSALMVLRYDPLNEKALRTRCRILSSQGNVGLAKDTYDAFAASWQESFGVPYSISFKDIIQ